MPTDGYSSIHIRNTQNTYNLAKTLERNNNQEYGTLGRANGYITSPQLQRQTCLNYYGTNPLYANSTKSLMQNYSEHDYESAIVKL